MKFSYRLRCSSGRHPSYTLTATNLGIQNLAFDGKLRTRDGETYALAGRFNTTGRANGTLKTNWQSNRYGRCRSGVIHWEAKR